MNVEEIIVNAIKRAKDERGLRVSKPNEHMANGHIAKADHNLVVMTDLAKLGHEDWVVIAAYYSMYQAAMALLAKIGLESKEHAATAAVLEYFFGSRFSRVMISRFNELKEQKDVVEATRIDEKYIDYLWKMKRERETVQYGISINYKDTAAAMRDARAFVSRIKLVANGLNEKLVHTITVKIAELEHLAQTTA